MSFEKIHLIYPMDNAAEDEYTKKLLRMTGCQIYGCPVESADPIEWIRKLRSINEPGGLDIVLNYMEDADPYAEDCVRQQVRRIYLYFDVERKLCDVSTHPLQNPNKAANKRNTRITAMKKLANEIWKGQPEVLESIQAIFSNCFESESQSGDLFYLMQAKRCLRVMRMGEVINDKDAYIKYIPLYSYVRTILERLSELYYAPVIGNSCYSLYTRINAAVVMQNIRNRVYGDDCKVIGHLFPREGEVFRLMQKLLDMEPTSISAMLLYARLCESREYPPEQIESAYQQVLRLLPENQRSYGFVWYRVGHFYEKEKQDKETALKYYKKAVEVDPEFYQAVFKLGQYAAAEGRFEEARTRLDEVIRLMFRGRDMGPDPDDTYPNWKYLSLKDCQYAYKTFVLSAIIAIKDHREYSARGAIGRACLAATKFETACTETVLSDDGESGYQTFQKYHLYSTPVWCMWKALYRWSEYIIQDDFVKNIVNDRLGRWH